MKLKYSLKYIYLYYRAVRGDKISSKSGVHKFSKISKSNFNLLVSRSVQCGT